jgi:hypothetical protein
MIDRYTTGVCLPAIPGTREKGELSLEFCYYKDTFGGSFSLSKNMIFHGKNEIFLVSDWI